MKNDKIIINDIEVNVALDENKDYICISDIAKAKKNNSRIDDIIRNWLRNRITLEFLGTWELLYNPDFKPVEFDGLKKNSGLHTFTLSVSEWVSKTNVIGIYVKKGRYGGTYAHKDIAFEFASVISPVFKLYLIKEFQKLNPELAKNNNIRDFATINELTVLSNLEYHNAELIKEGKSKEERFEILLQIAKYQLNVLNKTKQIKNQD